MVDLVQDLRFGVRILFRHPAITIISMLTLGLGIGATTAVFSLVDATLLTPLPFEEPDRLVRLFTSKPAAGWARMTVSAPDFKDWSDQNSSFEAAGIYSFQAVNVRGDEHPDRLRAVLASAEVLRVLRIQPTLGRLYEPSADHADAERLVLLSDATWRQRFGAKPEVVGTTLQIDGVPHEVLGILPPEVEAAVGRFDLWTPFTYDSVTESRSSRHFATIARLREGVTASEADRETKVIGERLAETYPESNRGHTVRVEPLTEVLLGSQTRPVLFVLCAAVGFVLLIACVNIANLLLTTAGSREREFAVRTAVGAIPRRLVRQLLTESTLLTIGGGLLGIAVALWGVTLLTAILPPNLRTLGEISVDGRALVFTLLALGLTSVGFGLPVALRASKSRFADVIRTSSRAVLGTPRERIRRDLLVVGQVALALALMISAGLMLRSLRELRAVDPGFDTDNLLTLRVSLPDQLYPSDSERSEFFERTVAEIAALPGVRSASASSMIPLLGSNSNSGMSIEDHPISDPADTIFVGNEAVTPGYCETMGIPLLEGREFNAFDRSDTAGVIIINQNMARHFWPDESAIGKRVKFGTADRDTPWLEVIGVMGDHRQTSLNVEPRFETLYPQAQMSSSAMTFVVRTHGNPASLTAEIQRTIWKVGPELAVYQVATMEEILARNTRSFDALANLLAGFGVIALVLALGGLYGVMSFSVARKTQEIGLRMALGAATQSILVNIIRKSLVLVLIGVLAGGLIAWFLGRLLQGVLFEVSALDPTAYIVTVAAMLTVGLLAGLVPALRAARVNPVIALRCE